MGDGDGWVSCDLGHRHWGRYGAAGLLLRDATRVVLQHRAPWSHQGGTWGTPGGARDSHESGVDGALREAAEEAGIDPAQVLISGQLLVEHGGWGYTTVLAEPLGDVEPRATDRESLEVRWLELADVATVAMHPGLAAAWPVLSSSGTPPTVVVDAANVMGSRPDGWWRDRPGAAARLYVDVLAWATDGVDPVSLPGADDRLTRVHPRVVLVLEGAARAATPPLEPRGRIVMAAGSGDDALVAVVAATDGPIVVVTADRELRRRVEALGAAVAGPRLVLGPAAQPRTHGAP